ncbi:hypothetical protein HNQ91_004206 [Filimonas zeae]|uniref:2'-5' RNA ligase n=1 Tax=Filimonas zeae TaxID=1737353 RepID=A0A917J3F2_9BACT|nr:2'-5' RNA ligase family protein [Filimonas zeae]MDR6341133.1 hypothetical protein [Filimonas zeae]GGH77096.1 hypothetical protein GCM10011379_42930 [Filimonas zeae]
MEGGVKLPGYAENEYLVVIRPNDDLYERIMAEKNSFTEKYNAAACTFGKPYLTLVRFNQVQMGEERIIRQLRGIATGCAPIKLELRNFGSYPTHSIFINLASKKQVMGVVRELRGAQRLMKAQGQTPHFITEPHFVIARKLNHEQYETAWREYAQQSFDARFMAEKLVLLKRKPGLSSFLPVADFDFMDKPVQAKQGALFG